VRPEANYYQSLELLQNADSINASTGVSMPVKSGIMVGLGEPMEELEHTMKDLHDHGCSIITVGQYMQPTKSHLKVEKYYTPDEFKELEDTAVKIGFKKIASGPFVRSSYNAKQLYEL
ncbi:MAG: lipoyl synthase, partial [Desulfobacula sp.]|nr:lipoyl synthase [Desulfobacula sp.]